jgi:hypothetical protein
MASVDDPSIIGMHIDIFRLGVLNPNKEHTRPATGLAVLKKHNVGVSNDSPFRREPIIFTFNFEPSMLVRRKVNQELVKLDLDVFATDWHVRQFGNATTL